MKLFERYIFRRAVTFFGAALAWTVAIVWTTQVLTRINLVTDNGQSALAFFEIAALILPSVLPVVIPFALIIAVTQTLSVMNNDSELIVISAAGAPRSITIRPVMLLAILAAVASFAIDNGADPYARQRGRELVAAARADFLSLVIQEGTFRKVDDGVFIQISERLPDGRLEGIFVADTRMPGTDMVYYAKSGIVRQNETGTVLIMQDGEIQRKLPGDDISVIRFLSYSFDLTALTASSGNPTLRPKDRSLGYLLDPDPEDQFYKRNPLSFSAELHRRFTEWLYPIVFALISLAVMGNARSNRDRRLHPMVTAVTIALLVRWVGYVSSNQVQVSLAFLPAVYGVPIVSSVVAAWFILTNRTLELPVTMTDRLRAGMRRIAERLSPSRFWRRDATSGGAN